jgi:hypothetical protein
LGFLSANFHGGRQRFAGNWRCTMSGIFLSYRRDDSAGFAGRLADRLEAEFGVGSVFRDVDDIRPGEDFQVAIDSQLRNVDVVLVIIGPRWLTASVDEQRRLDDPRDFVRLEIATALASGQPLIPVLVGGAAMPDAGELPAALAALARHQAVVLADGGWQNDVAQLLAALRPLLLAVPKAAGNSRRLLVGCVVVALIAAMGGWLFLGQRPPQPAPSTTPAPTAPANVAGRWGAKVKYDWGDTYDEVFEFKPLGQTLHGTASFLRAPLTIEQTSIDGEWLRFTTRSHEMLGSDSPRKEVTHRYTGRVTPDGILFTLESGGGYSIHPPLEFVARRLAPVP